MAEMRVLRGRVRDVCYVFKRIREDRRRRRLKTRGKEKIYSAQNDVEGFVRRATTACIVSCNTIPILIIVDLHRAAESDRLELLFPSSSL